MAANLPPELLEAIKWNQSTWATGPVAEDSFYTVGPETVDAAPGTLFKVEHVNPKQFAIPPGLSLSRFSYQSLSLDGKRVPVSGYVLFPFDPLRQPDGGWRVVAWAHGTTGMRPEAAPSHRRDLEFSYLVPFPLALAGYVVVATDYAGLGIARDGRGAHVEHEYLAAPAQANDVLFALPAARAAFAELGREFVVLGHSQGGHVAWAVAEKLARDPVDGFLGAIPISPVTRQLNQPADSMFYEPLGAAILRPVKSLYPAFEISDVLNDEGMLRYGLVEGLDTHVFPLIAALVGKKILKPGWEDNQYIKQYVDRATVGDKPVCGPMLVIQGLADEKVVAGPVEKAVLAAAELNKDQSIEYISLANVMHDPTLFVSQRYWLRWIDQRFEGVPAQKGFQRRDIASARPAEVIQPELTYYLGFATQLFQLP